MSARLLRFLLVLLLAVAFGRYAKAEEPNSRESDHARGPAVEPAEKPGQSTGSDSAEPSNARSATPTTDEAGAEPEEKKPKRGELELATFGGGCFWCLEAVFQRVPGVRAVVSGYSGGNVPFPNYAQVSSGATGHAEVVQIAFEPAVVSYEKLLEVFWRSHDPTTPNAQGPDVGTQYRSIILYHSEKQKKAIAKVYRELRSRRVLRGPVVTQVVPYLAFFPAEPYHQNYYNNHPFDPYSMIYIAPKFDVFRKMTRKPKGKTKAK